MPRDSEGYQCGQDSEVLEEKFLFFFDLSKCANPIVPVNGCPTQQVCVKECPSKSFLHDIEKCKEDVTEYKKNLICRRDVDLSRVNDCNAIDKLIYEEKCAKWYLKSEPCKLIIYFEMRKDF